MQSENHIVRLLVAVLLIGGTVVFCGCHSTCSTTPRDQFLARHPRVAAQYVILAPTSWETMAYEQQFRFSLAFGLIEKLRAAFSGNDELLEYLAAYELRLQTAQAEEAEMFAEIKKALPSEHYLYYFERKRDGMEETGHLALDGRGRIVQEW